MTRYRSGRRSVGTMSIVSSWPSRRMRMATRLSMRDAVQHAGDVVDARDGLLVEADDHVAGLQAARHGRAAGLNLDDAHGRLLRQARLDPQPLRQVHLVAGDAEARAAHAAVLQHLGQHVLRRVGGNREADALRAHDDGGVDADHLGARVDQRPAGVAGVERGIGLDHVADQAAVLRAQRAPDRADDAGGDRRTRSRTGCRWRWRSGRA